MITHTCSTPHARHYVAAEVVQRLNISHHELLRAVRRAQLEVCTKNGRHPFYTQEALDSLTPHLQPGRPKVAKLHGLTLSYAAKLLRVSRHTLAAWMEQGHLTATAVGKRHYITPTGLQAVIGELQPDDVVMTSKEVAKHLGVSRQTLQYWEEKGWLVPLSLPGTPRYLKRHLPKPFDTLDEPVLTPQQVAKAMGKSVEWIDYWVGLYGWRQITLPSGRYRYLQREVAAAQPR